MKEEACFITVTAWDKQAEVCNQYLQKGRPVFVEGRLQSRSWETPDGQKRNVIEVRAERIQFLGSSPRSEAPSAGGPAEEPAPTAAEETPKPDDMAWEE